MNDHIQRLTFTLDNTANNTCEKDKDVQSLQLENLLTTAFR